LAIRNLSKTTHHVLICNGVNCMKRQGEEVTLTIRDEIAKQEADMQIHTSRTLCNGRCEDACVVIAYPEGVWYREVTPEIARKIVKDHLLQGKVYEEHELHSFSERQ
jgi:(2Fe-2S) ferredoxin